MIGWGNCMAWGRGVLSVYFTHILPSLFLQLIARGDQQWLTTSPRPNWWWAGGMVLLFALIQPRVDQEAFYQAFGRKRLVGSMARDLACGKVGLVFLVGACHYAFGITFVKVFVVGGSHGPLGFEAEVRLW